MSRCYLVRRMSPATLTELCIAVVLAPHFTDLASLWISLVADVHCNILCNTVRMRNAQSFVDA